MNISGAVGGQIDKIIIAPLLGFELLGNYSLAMQFLIIMMLLPTIIFKYLLIQDSSGKNTGNLKQISFIISIGLASFGIIILPMLIPFLFPQFIETTIAIQILSIAIIPATVGTFYESKLLSLEKGKFPIISKSLGIVIVIFGFLTLGPIFGIIGLSITIVASSIIQTIFIIIATKISGLEN
jgi:O-antigen/teichoic acid export membrane protein